MRRSFSASIGLAGCTASYDLSSSISVQNFEWSLDNIDNPPHTPPQKKHRLKTLFPYAEKSAAAVAAFVASLFKVAPQTAPLWPKNVPIQSPVSPWRSIGLPSAREERREKELRHTQESDLHKFAYRCRDHKDIA